MKTIFVLTIALLAAFSFAAIAASEPQMVRVSMTVLLDDKVVSSPTLIVANGKNATIRVTSSTSTMDSIIEAQLTPTLQPNGSFNIPIKLTLTDEHKANPARKTSRGFDMELTLNAGKEGQVEVGPPQYSARLTVRAQVALLTEQESARLRSLADMKKP